MTFDLSFSLKGRIRWHTRLESMVGVFEPDLDGKYHVHAFLLSLHVLGCKLGLRGNVRNHAGKNILVGIYRDLYLLPQ